MPRADSCAQRVHRLPEAVVPVGGELPVSGKPVQRRQLPGHVIARDPLQCLRVHDEETAIDIAVIAERLLGEPGYQMIGEDDRAETARRTHHGNRRLESVRLVKVDQCANVDISHAIAIGEAERFVGAQVTRHALEPRSSYRCRYRPASPSKES